MNLPVEFDPVSAGLSSKSRGNAELQTADSLEQVPAPEGSLAANDLGRLERGSLFVVGLGNLLMSDDGIGIHALAELRKTPIPGVRMVEIGTAILHGLSLLESATRVLAIDAVYGGQPPGTIHFFDVEEPLAPEPASCIHALGLREAMRFFALATPPPFSVIGVEPQTIGYGMELSAAVQEALPRVVALARNTVREWIQRPDWIRPSRGLPETTRSSA